MSELRFDQMCESEFIDTIIYDSKNGINRDYKTCLEKMQYHFGVAETLRKYCWGGLELSQYYANKKKKELCHKQMSDKRLTKKNKNLFKNHYDRKKRRITNDDSDDDDIDYRLTCEDNIIISITMNTLRAIFEYHKEIYPEHKYQEQCEINRLWKQEQKQLDEETQAERQKQRDEDERIRREIKIREEADRINSILEREKQESERKAQLLKWEIQRELQEQDRLEWKRKDEEKQKLRKKENEERKLLRNIERKNNSEVPICCVCFDDRNLVDGNCGCTAEYCIRCIVKLDYKCCLCKQSFID